MNIFKWASLAIVTATLVAPCFADCKINIKVKNVGNYQVQIINSTDSTGAKVKGGTWRPLNNGYWLKNEITFWMNPGVTKGDDYSATFGGCDANRQYRIIYYCEAGPQKGSSFTKYFPSATDYTTQQTFTINLGGLCNE